MAGVPRARVLSRPEVARAHRGVRRFVRLDDVVQDALQRRFAETLADITSGNFVRRFQEELAAGSPTRLLIEAMIGGGGGDPLSRAEAAV